MINPRLDDTEQHIGHEANNCLLPSIPRLVLPAAPDRSPFALCPRSSSHGDSPGGSALQRVCGPANMSPALHYNMFRIVWNLLAAVHYDIAVPCTSCPSLLQAFYPLS